MGKISIPEETGVIFPQENA